MVARGVPLVAFGRPGLSVKEWHERSLWTGEVNVIEVTRPVGKDIVKKRWVTDRKTGRLISAKQWRGTDGHWKLLGETEEVRWGRVPNSVWQFVPPKGTTVEYSLWWKSRLGPPLAIGETQHWQVFLHAVDADKQGDLVLTMSARPTSLSAAGARGGVVPLQVEGVDSLGGKYHYVQVVESRPHYVALRLRRSPSPIAPGPRGPSACS